MSIQIKVKKGLDLNLCGRVTDTTARPTVAVRCAVTPDDFTGLVPRIDVKEGDKVACGQPLMHDKDRPGMKLVSPVAGTVSEVVRGERRKLLRVVVTADGSDNTIEHAIPKKFTRDELIALLGEAGLLAMMRRRPFDTVVRPEAPVRDIFVTALDTAPLAVDPHELIPADCSDELARAVEALKVLTEGKVYVAVRPGKPEIKGAEMIYIDGPHPAGNVGTQIAAIAPIDKGQTVWTLDLVTLYKIGVLLKTGRTDWHVTVAVCGPKTPTCGLAHTIAGADIASVLAPFGGTEAHTRIVSGNVLTGTAIDLTDYLRWPYRQVTLIAEGDNADEFMGWASLSPKKMSTSPSFPGHFLKRGFAPDARLLGGRRAMIMSGQFDKVMPMDILPEYLLRAIIGRDIDEMEKLGIYEVAPEDFALAEYVDTSKMPLQQIVREGLDYLSKETE